MTRKRVAFLALVTLAVAVVVPATAAGSVLVGTTDPANASCAETKIVTVDNKRPLTLTDGASAYAVQMVPYRKHCAIQVASASVGVDKGAQYQVDIFPSEFAAQTGGNGKGNAQRDMEFSVIDRPIGGGTGIATREQAIACYDGNGACPVPDRPWNSLKIE